MSTKSFLGDIFVGMGQGETNSNNLLAFAKGKGQGKASRNNHLDFPERAIEGERQRHPEPFEKTGNIFDTNKAIAISRVLSLEKM